jgi:hypothetical protein
VTNACSVGSAARKCDIQTELSARTKLNEARPLQDACGEHP